MFGQDFFSAVLKGPRITLLPYSEERDFNNIAHLLSDPTLTAPMGIPNPCPFLEELKRAKQERLSCEDVGDWTAFLENDFIGEVGIASSNPAFKLVEIFVTIASEQWGKGLGRESVSVLMKHIFNVEAYATVRIRTLISNTKALRMCASLGFKITGSRHVEADPGRGLQEGTWIIADCHLHEFTPFPETQETAS